MTNVYNDIGNEIAKLAFEIYEKSGRIEGRCLDNWLEAERIVMAKYRAMENQGEVREEKPKKTAKKSALKKPVVKKSAEKPASEKKPKTTRAKKTK